VARSIEDLRADRVKTYVAPIIPIAFLGICIAFVLAGSVSWLRDRPNLGMILLTLAVSIVVLLSLAYALRQVALQGRVDATGWLGITGVTVVATTLSITGHYNGNGVIQAMPYCSILAVSSVFFWPRDWQFAVAMFGMIGPPIVLLYVGDENRDIRFVFAQLALYTVIICVALYLLMRYANQRNFALALEVEFRATHDGLTGLSNRTHWVDRATERLTAQEKGEGTCALLFIDVNGFKRFNDGAGHIAGDRYLIELANVLKGAIDETELICRFGGDEFVALIANTASGEVEAIAANIHEALEQIDGEAAGLTVSLGIAYRRPAETLDHLILRADAAMFAAKASDVKAVSM
jgi:diguanylate cyclase (GGDEF)-like protein